MKSATNAAVLMPFIFSLTCFLVHMSTILLCTFELNSMEIDYLDILYQNQVSHQITDKSQIRESCTLYNNYDIN